MTDLEIIMGLSAGLGAATEIIAKQQDAIRSLQLRIVALEKEKIDVSNPV